MIEKINHNHLLLNPKHIYVRHIIDQKVYDVLYENWNNLKHFRWKNFIENYNLNLKFYNDLHEINDDHQQRYKGFWFFKDRIDKRKTKIIISDKKEYQYWPNVLLIVENNTKVQFTSDKIDTNMFKPCITIKFTDSQLKLLDNFFRI